MKFILKFVKVLLCYYIFTLKAISIGEGQAHRISGCISSFNPSKSGGLDLLKLLEGDKLSILLASNILKRNGSKTLDRRMNVILISAPFSTKNSAIFLGISF